MFAEILAKMSRKEYHVVSILSDCVFLIMGEMIFECDGVLPWKCIIPLRVENALALMRLK